MRCSKGLSTDEREIAHQFESYNEFLDRLGVSDDDQRRSIADIRDGIKIPPHLFPDGRDLNHGKTITAETR